MIIPFSVSAFFPVYNDGESVKKIIPEAIRTLSKLTSTYEIILINDGSTDGSEITMKKLEKKYKSVRVVSHEKNLGYGAALKTGFAESKCDLIFYTDGDGQYDVKELATLFGKIKEGDLINGYKRKRSDNMFRSVIGEIYNWGVKLLFNLKVRDVDCDFRLIRRSVFDKVSLNSNGGSICVELIKKIQNRGFAIVEVPVGHYWRKRGKSRFFRIVPIAKLMYGLILLWIPLMILERKE